jgi:hypothetical protein
MARDLADRALKARRLSEIERKLKLLTANADDYFWDTDLGVEKRWTEARLKLRGSVLRALAKELLEFERLTDKMTRALRTAQLAALGRKQSAESLLESALASIEHLKLTALTLTRRMDEALKQAEPFKGRRRRR